MTLTERLRVLPPSKMKYIHSVIAEASLASELNSFDKAKEIIRLHKNKSLGLTRKIFTKLDELDEQQFEGVKKALLS